MPRRKGTTARRLQPRDFPVSEAIIAEEARRIDRELDDLMIRSQRELEDEANSLYARGKQEWEAIQAKLAHVKERERAALRRCLFRDLLLLLKAYEASSRNLNMIAPTATQPVNEATPFCEWLFETC